MKTARVIGEPLQADRIISKIQPAFEGMIGDFTFYTAWRDSGVMAG